MSKICIEGHNQNIQKKSCRFKTWMEIVRQTLMKLKTSSSEGLLMKVFSHSVMWLSKHCSGHLSVHTDLMGLRASAVMWLTGGLHAMRCVPGFRAIRQIKPHNSPLRVFVRSCAKTSICLVMPWLCLLRERISFTCAISTLRCHRLGFSSLSANLKRHWDE